MAAEARPHTTLLGLEVTDDPVTQYRGAMAPILARHVDGLGWDFVGDSRRHGSR